MKIKRLELSGFKSFVDRTVVNFDHDVLGIVGPNGCGKSNIVDAIRWCMGEQSAKHLRGRSMEDVIFNGSETRGAHDLAEVTLTFENNDPTDMPLEYRDYAEIAVTRRLHRSGDSEYLINKTQVRLKDVTDLFLGTGVGTKAYSIVEQGKIGLIVSAKPEDRRMLIEEAAGITKFKSRKKQAERKMELTQQNLLRIGDIVAEIERNLGSLKRQAAKAERYLSYRNELEDLQLHDASHRYLEHTGYIKWRSDEVATCTLAFEEARNALMVREAELETLRLSSFEAEGALEQATTAHFAAVNAVSAEEAAIERTKDRSANLKARETQIDDELKGLYEQRAALEAECNALADEASQAEAVEAQGAETVARAEEVLRATEDALRAREAALEEIRAREQNAQKSLASAEAKLETYAKRRDDEDARLERMKFDQNELEAVSRELTSRLKRLDRDVEELRSGKRTTQEERERLEETLKEHRIEILAAERSLEEVKAAHQQARSRLQALLEVQARLDGVGSGVRSVLASGDASIVGLVADRIEVPEQYTQAVAALLGARFEDIVVTDQEQGMALITALRDAKKGRATIVPRYARTVAGCNAGEGGTRVFSVLTFTEEDTNLVHSLVGDARIVDTEEEAATLARALAVPVVTIHGTLFHADGRVTGGVGEQVAAGLLETKRETRELSGSVHTLEQQVAEALERFHGLRATIADVQTSLERARHEAHQGELALVTSEKDRVTTQGDLERTEKRVAQLASDIEALSHTLLTAEDEKREAERTVQTENETLEALHAERAAAQAHVDAERHVVGEHRELVTQARVDLGSRREKLNGARGAVTRLTRSIEELSDRARRLSDEATQCAMQFGEACGLLITHRDALFQALDVRQAQERVLEQTRSEFEAVRGDLNEREGLLKSLRTDAETAKEALQGHELQLREHEMALAHLLDSVREKFRGLQLNRIVGDYHLRLPPDAESKQRINELATLIERMGSVNLEAMKEHKEAEERYAFYTTQKADLDQALADLERAIQQMNRESKRLFKETFDAVNTRFQEIFPKMFRGGGASLRLTNPEDMLETGIDILAQPPGKKLSSIELMSGGEKALTAVSLIFAIFQIKPSPFCILDEVDAPLDEANVARYNEMVREMTDRSQFILITHIKRTMQMVDVLYGVTMQESGVSRLVSVKLSEGNEQKRTKPAAAVSAAAVA